MSDERKWTALLVGERSGLLHQHGDKFHGSPERYERVDVVPMSILLELQAEVTTLRTTNDLLTSALARLRDCDWIITPLVCAELAVREIAREALKEQKP